MSDPQSFVDQQLQQPEQPPPIGTRVADIENRAIDRYRTVTEDVKPYLAQVGDKVYTFNRRASATLQLQAMHLFSRMNEQGNLAPEDVGIVRELLDAMLDARQNVDELFAQLDLQELANLLGKAMERTSEHPTTGSSDSSTSALKSGDTGSLAAHLSQQTSRS